MANRKKVIPTTVAEKCIGYRKRAKRGESLSPEESKFCREMLRMFPEWYRKTEAKVFNETVPFGSGAKMRED